MNMTQQKFDDAVMPIVVTYLLSAVMLTIGLVGIVIAELLT